MKKQKTPLHQKVQIQDSSSAESELSDIVHHPAFNKTKKQKKQIKDVEKQLTPILHSEAQKKTREVYNRELNSEKFQKKPVNKPSISNKKDQGFQICLQGLSFDAFGPDIRSLFEDCGKIVKLKVLTDKSGKSKGVAFARFATQEQFREALLKDGVNHMGRYIKVSAGQKKQGSQHNWKQSFTTLKQQNKSSTLFIGNLPLRITENQIYSHFQDNQQINDIRVIKDRSTGQSKGYGHIEFIDEEAATKAFNEFNGSVLQGRHIRLDYANPRTK